MKPIITDQVRKCAQNCGELRKVDRRIKQTDWVVDEDNPCLCGCYSWPPIAGKKRRKKR